jgi:enoyl-CoA hydratase
MASVTTKRHGGTLVITYANPGAGTLTAPGTSMLLAALRAGVADPEVRCIIFTGGLPDIFIRHYDVVELAVMADVIKGVIPAPAPPAEDDGGYYALVDTAASAPKPVIAAINGLCMGGGFELALACDLRIAGTSVAAIGLPETRIGIFPGGGGTQRLPRVIGEAKALEMILRGLVVTGPQAAAQGLVHEVVDDPLARALEIAGEFATRPAEGLAEAKRLIRSALNRPFDEGTADERRSFMALLKVPSAGAAMQAALDAGTPIERV